MFKRSLFILVVFAAMFQANFASAQLKIGVYDNSKVLESLPSVQKEFKKLAAEFEPKRQEISNKQNGLKKLQEDIEKNGPILSLSLIHI